MTATNLFAQQEANKRRTRWLVFSFILFFAWVGFGGDLGFYLLTRDAPAQSYHHTIPIIGLILTAAGLGITWYSFKKGPGRVLWAAGAWEIVEPATPEQKQLVNVVEEMAIASGLPVPKIWIVPDSDPNAFATGLDQQHANIAVTEGLLKTLNRDEIQAVIAHEMAHINNLDVRLMTLLAAMVGAIALMSDGMGRMLGRGGVRASGGGGKSGGGKKGNQLAILILVFWVITLILAPIISRILAMAVSRKREYLADASSAQFTRNPGALASALEKLDAAAEPTKSITQGTAHLCIVSPSARAVNSKEGRLADFLASHPPMRRRIAALKGMAFQQAKQGQAEPA
ncbi:MAG: M48 family metallopeptidase [Gemmatimonadota bacterium]